MNSNPHENAAWRSFGMLDADKADSFDAALRLDPELQSAAREIDCLSAAVAVTATIPVAPRAGQLERLHLRLGIQSRKRTNWLAISGWAAAAVLAAALFLKQPAPTVRIAAETAPSSTVSPPRADFLAIQTEEIPVLEEPAVMSGAYHRMAETVTTEVGIPLLQATTVRVETKRLIQEIEVLREKLETFEELDRKLFEPADGIAWPVVMRMRPPPAAAAQPMPGAAAPEALPLTAMLGDALTVANSAPGTLDPALAWAGEMVQADAVPSAVPIYDTARDTGTLVVGNLPKAGGEEAYNLWVVTEEGGRPVHVGRIPESKVGGTDSFDFSLGSTSIVPSGFILTKDTRRRKPPAPSAVNIVLIGP